MMLKSFRSQARSIATMAALGLAALVATPSADAAGLLIADGGLGGVLEIKEQDVKVVVNNGVSVTTIDQIFLNTEDRQVEALYTFPVPKGASVSNFSMWINGKEMVGEVVEKKRAREIYQSYKQVRRDPGLLEQVDYRTFEMRVFPIAPRAEQRVQVVYYQELDFDHDRATYVYPLATSTRPGINARTTGKFALSMDVKSQVPIAKLASTSHPDAFAVARYTDNYQTASLEVRGGDLSRDVVLSIDTSRPRTGVDLITSKPAGGEDGYFSLTLTAGEELAANDKPMDYLFVLDVSGSMNDDQKLQISQRALGSFIAGLSPEDRFEVLTFNVEPTALFNSLTAADPASKERAQQFLASQQARGGTVLNRVMTRAYKYAEAGRSLNVVLLSDGMTEQSERAELSRLIKQRPTDSRVFAIGVGNDVNRGLLEQITNDSGGLAAFVSRDDDLERQGQAFRRKLMRPVATDVAIKIEGIDAYAMQPAQLPNLYHGMPIRVYGRYKRTGDANVAVSAKVGGQDLKQSVKFNFPDKDDANPEIERMWAWKTVDGLLKKADAEGSRQPVIDEIVKLGEGYSIVTEYTSFLVLENDSEYRRWKIDRRNALRVSRDREAQQRVARAMEQMRSTASNDLGPAAVDKAVLASAASAATPAVSVDGATQGPQLQSPVNVAPRPSGQSRDFSMPSRGGGAIDGITGVIALCLGAAAWAARKKH